MKTIHLSIVAGAQTCASEPGTFCRFLVTTNFGTRWRCKVFDPPDARERSGLKEIDGWIQRHPDCLAAERDVDMISRAMEWCRTAPYCLVTGGEYSGGLALIREEQALDDNPAVVAEGREVFAFIERQMAGQAAFQNDDDPPDGYALREGAHDDWYWGIDDHHCPPNIGPYFSRREAVTACWSHRARVLGSTRDPARPEQVLRSAWSRAAAAAERLRLPLGSDMGPILDAVEEAESAGLEHGSAAAFAAVRACLSIRGGVFLPALLWGDEEERALIEFGYGYPPTKPEDLDASTPLPTTCSTWSTPSTMRAGATLCETWRSGSEAWRAAS